MVAAVPEVQEANKKDAKKKGVSVSELAKLKTQDYVPPAKKEPTPKKPVDKKTESTSASSKVDEKAPEKKASKSSAEKKPTPAVDKKVVEKKPTAEKKPATEKAPKKQDAPVAEAAAKRTKTPAGEKRTELRRPQIVLLQTIGSNPGVTRNKLVELHKGVNLSEHLESLKGAENKFTVSLVQHGLVASKVQETTDGKSSVTYTLTKSGESRLKGLAKS
jgi:hypothetical protein